MKELQKPRYIASPSRNFCILNSSIMNDPKDGRDKLMFTSFVAGGTGIFAIVDPETDTGESYMLPCDNGAWAVCRVDERRIAIGTCATKGAIHTFDLLDRKFIKTSYVKNNTYVWNLVKASDGCLYGGTYPGNVIVRYSPDTMEAEVITRCDSSKGNYYSRTVYPDENASGNIIISCGMDEPEVCIYNIYENKIKANIPGTLITVNQSYFSVKNEKGAFFDKTHSGNIGYFDRETCEYIETDTAPEIKAVPASKQTYDPKRAWKAVAYKQGYKFTSAAGEVSIRMMPVTPPPTAMLNIACDARDRLWGAAGFGQTVCMLDTDTGEFKNTNVVTNNGGEVYGIVPIDKRIYLTAYAGCMHIVYYPDKPWSQEDNTNPYTFKLFSEEGFVRPEGRSVIGPDGNIYTGLMANYGTYGGAVSKTFIDTNTTALWKNEVNDYAVASVFSDGAYIYAATCGHGNGMPTRDIPTFVFKLDCDLKLIKYFDCGKKYFSGAGVLNGVSCVACYDGSDGKQYLYFTSDGFETLKKQPVDFRISNLISVPSRGVYVFTSGAKLGIIRQDGTIEELYGFERHISHICASPSGRVFASCEEQIFECEL